MKRLVYSLLAVATLLAASPAQVLSQTFVATQAVHEVKCRSFLGIYDQCVTIETDRLHSTFTRNRLGYYLFGRTWASASHCTRVDPAEQKCAQSVFVSTDPEWNRVTWGQSANNFLRVLGTGGTVAEGPWHFLGPLGADISRREGEWHVAFVADSRNNRIVVLALGYSCRCARWLGTLDGAESGTPLRNPHDVAWDHVDTWSLADDRVFIADTENDRVVVYQVNLNPVAGTMTKAYLGTFGSRGQGPNQFSGPQGLTVRSFSTVFQVPWGTVTLLSTHVYVSDTDNHRVAMWTYETDNTATPAAQSAPIAGAEFVGITHDYYGDVVVADRARDVLMKFEHYNGEATLAPLKTYGATPSWSTGNFNHPTDAAVIPHHWQDSTGHLIHEALPYVQTVEQWTAATGGQLHHLGVDADELAATPGQCDATLTFLLTAYGDYTVRVVNYGTATVVASWAGTGVGSGRKSEYWNASGSPAGLYTWFVDHRNAYGDETQWRTSPGPSFNLNCFTVTASVPDYVSASGTYALSGSSNQPADSWTWERDGSPWSSGQNSSVYIPDDPGATYTINWRLSARRTSDGLWDSDTRSTYVSIPSPPPPPPPECPPYCDEGPLPSAGTTRVLAQEATPTRRNHHLGSGAWIGERSANGIEVVQLYSFVGQHERRGATWPNPLASDGDLLEEPDRAKMGARAAFAHRSLAPGLDAYRIRVGTRRSPGSERYIGLALDPELGARPSDDLLGIDAESGLIWVADPESGAIGYLVPEVPLGARVAVRQFSTRKDAWRPDPVTDSAAYAEISAGGDALTGKPGDVRLLVAIGPLPSGTRSAEVGLVMLTAPSLAALRERVAGAPRSVLNLFATDTTPLAGTPAITRFRLTQAPPDPTASEGVQVVSPALIPALSAPSDSAGSGNGDRSTLRDAVRRYGITALAFTVPDTAQANVRIRLYDPSGRLVRTLVEDTYGGGAYRVQWDLKDQRGRRVAPGVYVAIMEAQGFRAMSRLVVLP